MKKILIFVFLVASILSCTKNTPSTTVEQGLKPVYISKSEAFTTRVEAPKTFTSPGKMFLYQSLILVTDFGEGVHIIDNSIDTMPKKIAFISIPGVRDASIKSGILYADNFTDIVAFDISDLSNIQLKKRVKNIYPLTNQLYPESGTGYFECADTTIGYVLRWETATLTNPKCYR